MKVNDQKNHELVNAITAFAFVLGAYLLQQFLIEKVSGKIRKVIDKHS